MILKRSVIIDGVRPQMMVAIGFLEAAYANFGFSLIITSAKDGNHKTGSKHYSGDGVDFRTKHLPGDVKHKILAFARAKLDPLGYDTILEYEGGENEHIHSEWDPKPGERLWRYEGEAIQSDVTMDHFG